MLDVIEFVATLIDVRDNSTLETAFARANVLILPARPATIRAS